MTRRDIEDQVRQARWPAPSLRLRDEVLTTAVIAAQPISWSDRVWFSRAWRLSAVVAALVVVVLNQMAGSPRTAGVIAVQPPSAVLSVDSLLDEFVGEGGGD